MVQYDMIKLGIHNDSLFMHEGKYTTTEETVRHLHRLDCRITNETKECNPQVRGYLSDNQVSDNWSSKSPSRFFEEVDLSHKLFCKNCLSPQCNIPGWYYRYSRMFAS